MAWGHPTMLWQKYMFCLFYLTFCHILHTVYAQARCGEMTRVFYVALCGLMFSFVLFCGPMWSYAALCGPQLTSVVLCGLIWSYVTGSCLFQVYDPPLSSKLCYAYYLFDMVMVCNLVMFI